MRQDVHRRDWKTYARQNQGARSTHPTRPYRDLRRFRACPLHRTQATLCLSSDSSFLRSFQNVVLYLNITLINTIVRFYKIFDKKNQGN